jgi:hypothetical protein
MWEEREGRMGEEEKREGRGDVCMHATIAVAL